MSEREGGRVGAAGAGDDEAFTAFVALARPGLGRVAYLMCGDWHAAEDVVQGVLVRLYGHWARVAAGGDAYGYARRAVVHAMVDEWRRPWRRERPVAELPDAADPTAATGVGGGGEDRAMRALAGLPKRQRAVVVLRYVEGMSVPEVAEELGISVGTVKSQAARGLDAIRAQLERGRVGKGQA